MHDIGGVGMCECVNVCVQSVLMSLRISLNVCVRSVIVNICVRSLDPKP